MEHREQIVLIWHAQIMMMLNLCLNLGSGVTSILIIWDHTYDTCQTLSRMLTKRHLSLLGNGLPTVERWVFAQFAKNEFVGRLFFAYTQEGAAVCLAMLNCIDMKQNYQLVQFSIFGHVITTIFGHNIANLVMCHVSFLHVLSNKMGCVHEVCTESEFLELKAKSRFWMQIPCKLKG